MEEGKLEIGINEVSMIGLGVMGTALATAQIEAGRNVTIWNRSSEKMAPLVALGAAIDRGW